MMIRNINLIVRLIKFKIFSGYGKDPKKTKFEFYGRIPRLTILGNYKLNGRVIILPVQGDGPANMTFGKMEQNLVFYSASNFFPPSNHPDNLDVSIRGVPRVEVKGGNEYLQFTKFNVDFTTTRLVLH